MKLEVWVLIAFAAVSVAMAIRSYSTGRALWRRSFSDVTREDDPIGFATGIGLTLSVAFFALIAAHWVATR